ncbi:hypothetical protein DFH07DRAFT_765421 [Mycena maculata]|uniref:Uncharacterized protein n=1 Tax=Mycena maculata TaxID=230809 RepID=A0AAD7K7U1_9AGAR|nr:hypothetical protein DFH07DRAFT_765421 [Mycena maculata]
MLISPFFVCMALALAWTAVVGTPSGEATGNTGGSSATPAVPLSLTELTIWLSNNVVWVILLKTRSAHLGPALQIPNPNYLTLWKQGAKTMNLPPAKSTATWYIAGTWLFTVGSNKTLPKGNIWWNGIGLYITGASNIIIQHTSSFQLNALFNHLLADIIPEFVWDALAIDGGSKIWVY